MVVMNFVHFTTAFSHTLFISRFFVFLYSLLRVVVRNLSFFRGPRNELKFNLI